MKIEKDKKTVQTIIDSSLLNSFKFFAAQEQPSKNVKDKLRQLIEEYVDQEKKRYGIDFNSLKT